jgi:hypothetical protein
MFPRNRNISDKICRENQKTFYIQYLFSENRAVPGTAWQATHYSVVLCGKDALFYAG